MEDLSDHIRYSCFFYVENSDPYTGKKVFQPGVPFEFYLQKIGEDRERRYTGVVKLQDDESNKYPHGYSMVSLETIKS